MVRTNHSPLIGQVILANNRDNDVDFLATIIRINGEEYTIQDQEEDVFVIKESQVIDWNPT